MHAGTWLRTSVFQVRRFALKRGTNDRFNPDKNIIEADSQKPSISPCNRNAVTPQTYAPGTIFYRNQCENNQEDQFILHTSACGPFNMVTTRKKAWSAKSTLCPLQRTLKLVHSVATALWPATSIALP